MSKGASDSSLTIIKLLIDSGKPIIGINRGMQLINIVYGGDLQQKILNSKVKHQISQDETHDINLVKNSKVYNSVLKKSEDLYDGYIKVNSMHAQVIGKIGNNLEPSAFTSDGVIEAIEMRSDGKDDDNFIIGVQWNPEYLNNIYDVNLFDSFCKSVANDGLVKNKK